MPIDAARRFTGHIDVVLVHAKSVTAHAWINTHPRPIVIDDPVDHDLIVEAYELEHAEGAGLVVWR